MRTKALIAVVAIVTAACGRAASSSAANCVEYAAEVRAQIDRMGGEELTAWLDDTSEHAARLISAEPTAAQPCVDAILEAALTAGVQGRNLFQD